MSLGTCGSCREELRPRGGLPPRFCPRCGHRLSTIPATHTGLVAKRAPRLSTTAAAALAVGVVGLGAPCGLVSLGAIALGVWAHEQIGTSRGSLTGGGLATAGIVLGILGSGLWLGVCGGIL